LADLSQKTLTRWACLIHRLLASGTVITRGRGAKKALGRLLQLQKGLAEIAGGIDPAMSDTRFFLLAPPSGRDPLPRQMNHRIEPFERVEIGKGALEIPEDGFFLFLRMRANKVKERVPLPLQKRD
jgi:hypothetical protein